MIATAVSPSIGVEVQGVSAADFTSRATASDTLELLARHGVVVFKQADISDADLVTFSRMLGDVVVAPIGGHLEFPEISPVSLDPGRSELARARRSTIFWHVDGVTDAIPQKATLLTAREVVDGEGDTEFANTYAAYEDLPDDRKAEFARYRVVHSMAAAQALTNPDATRKQKDAWDRLPAREHPLVWEHRDGRRSLLIGATAGQVVGMSPEEGRALLDSVLDWATRPQFVLRHRWQVGDLVMWDNTGLLHRALPYEPTSRRLMHRTTLVGDEAVA
ncbi:TauD/TfdA dioxygenase family protein [Rhodococcus artemisiae]|uniref:TauD/TfdA family dioxygenase n=1 Tax=Rhodococcus artemisiae TaxID=714159 RepID=A0ABU7LAB4_9NOCA|nr:TauD/TfdA family dioxygenase [Rhodococcus artemisiae]MEE2058459.1 TauD/TfdA family dioxygenase [Rhodococcus artemisiae]